MFNGEKKYLLMKEALGGDVIEVGSSEGQDKLKKVESLDKSIQIARGLTESDGDTIRFAKIATDVSLALPLNDAEKREYADQLMAIANDSKEHSRSDRRELVKEIFANNNDIPDGADYADVAEFINGELFGEFAENFVNIDVTNLLPKGVDDMALKLHMVGEAKNIMNHGFMGDIIKDAETMTEAQGEEKYGELIKAFESAEIDFTQIMSGLQKPEDFTEENTAKILADMKIMMTKLLDGQFGEGTYEKYSSRMLESVKKSQIFSGNLRFFKETSETQESQIDFSRTTVIAYIGEIKTPLDDTNSSEEITRLLELSTVDYDRDAELEKAVASINDLSESTATNSNLIENLIDLQQTAGKNLSEVLIDLSNKTGLGALIAKIFEKIGLLFGPEFQEAISESNLRKQKALFNLVKISSEEGEGFKMDGVDFSNIKSSQLKKFFTAMDSRGIKYEHENFWENLMTGEVDGDGADVEGVATIRKELQGEDENVFTKENDFSNNNTGFKDRLNAIEKKKDEVVDGNGDAVVVGDSTLKTDTPK